MQKTTACSVVGLAALTMVGLVACGPPKERIAELEAAAAQRDTLLQEVADLAQLMSDVNEELANVQLEGVELAATESPRQAVRDSMLTRIRVMNARLDSTQTRLQESRRRVRGLTQISDSLRRTLEATIASYERMLEAERTTIATLTTQVQSLEAETVRLAVAVDTLSAAVDTLRTEAETVYYVIGTKQELLERGIAAEEGGARVLFIFGRAGKTLVPGRDLDPADFMPINKWSDTRIALPDSSRTYRIVSRQDVGQLAVPPDEKGRMQGTALEIVDPGAFWAASKFLIVVQE